MDKQRLDFGLIISRPPIFISIETKQLEYERHRH